MKFLINNWLVYALFAKISQNVYVNGLCHLFGVVFPISLLQAIALVLGMVVFLPLYSRQRGQVMRTYGLFTKGVSRLLLTGEPSGGGRVAVGLFSQLRGYLAARKAISVLRRTGTFVLYYQPQYDTARQCVSSLEVLIRHRNHHGVVTPPTFLNYFVQLGLMPALDLWVMEQALNEVAPLASDSHFKVSINISPQTVLIPNFAKTVTGLIEKSKLGFHQVELEITEESLIDDEVTTWDVLQQLRWLGVKIALDDFGSGYSSIGYLNRFEFDKVKIDRSLLLNLTQKNGREMFRLTSELIRTMGAEIVVEGVESIEQLTFITDQNIHLVQGYLFYRPMLFREIHQSVPFCPAAC